MAPRRGFRQCSASAAGLSLRLGHRARGPTACGKKPGKESPSEHEQLLPPALISSGWLWGGSPLSGWGQEGGELPAGPRCPAWSWPSDDCVASTGIQKWPCLLDKWELNERVTLRAWKADDETTGRPEQSRDTRTLWNALSRELWERRPGKVDPGSQPRRAGVWSAGRTARAPGDRCEGAQGIRLQARPLGEGFAPDFPAVCAPHPHPLTPSLLHTHGHLHGLLTGVPACLPVAFGLLSTLNRRPKPKPITDLSSQHRLFFSCPEGTKQEISFLLFNWILFCSLEFCKWLLLNLES